ncbi:MAG: hypothetical protein ABJO45_12620 [Lentilitoribacter sp.]
MPIDFEIVDKIFCTQKYLLPPFDWKTVPASNTKEQRQCFETRIKLEGTIPRGVWFRITIFPGSLIRSVFQLECDIPNSRTHVPLYRLELDPLTAHTNKLYGDDEVNGVFIDAGVTHEHIFYDSLKPGNILRKPNRCDEQARIVKDPPSDFAHALSYVAVKIELQNADQIPHPNAQGLLF